MSIAERWLFGGDEYESIEERAAFYERVQADKEEILDTLKSVVSTWTENEIEDGNEPVFEHFLDEYKEWDHDALYDVIEAEMNRVKELCSRERAV